MGNIHSGSTFTRTTNAIDSFVTDLGADVVYEKSLGYSRFLKTVKCKHRNGYLVIKIFIKPDPGLSLRNYTRRLKLDKEALVDIPNVYNYQGFAETERAGYIIRQWVASNLYDRISTRPFLSTIEKKWIAFQVFNALRDARNRNISHGDIKSENILVTSWNWVYVTDFASYKPAYLPLDDPSDFSFYFDTSGRRTCYVAPERFYTEGTNPEISAKKTKIALDETFGKRDGKITEAMDCFSAGCVIAELFLEGAPLFTLSQLYKYREGEFNVDAQLSGIEDEAIRNLIKQMIQLDPAGRPSFDTLLHTSRGTVFPEAFYSFLHNYVSTINEITPFTNTNTPAPATPLTATPSRPTTTMEAESRPSDSDHRLERLWEDYESIEPYLYPESNQESENLMDVNVEYSSLNSEYKPFQDVIPVEVHIPNRDSKLKTLGGRRSAIEDGPALIILALLTANIRNCRLPSSKVHTLDVFLALSCHLTDEAKLDRMVPYIVELLHDDSALVRSAAMRTLLQVLVLVSVITPSNVAIFPEYIIPNIKHLIQDPEVSVRCTYAQCIVQLADTAVRYLEMGQALKAHGAFNLAAEGHDHDNAHYEISYDSSMQELQNHIQDHLSALLMDPSSIVKRAVLHNISSLCVFLGRQKTNDVLLSHMITYLNDRDWLLRYAFFESIVDVAACAGGRSLEEYILPLMIQALSDVEESVVARVLAALTSLCELGLFQKMRIWELMSATLGFLYHPNIWIRQGAAAFITSAAQHLPVSDVWCILYPSLRHFLKSDVADVNATTVLRTLKPPLPRQILDASVQWAMKADRNSFWSRPKQRTGAKLESPRESVISMKKGAGSISRNKSEQDDENMTKLQQLGLTSSDETKLLAMRDYILRLANATSSFSSRLNSEPDTGKSLKVIGNIELQKLGVVPTTHFLRARSEASPSNRQSFASSRRTASGRTSAMMSPARFHRGSIDQTMAGAPFEDLRRRLATINGSSASLTINPPAPGGRSVSSPFALSSASHSVTSVNSPNPERPPSPTDSVVSTSNSVSLKPSSRLHVGSADGSKAAPAIGASKTTAQGLFEAHTHLGSPDPSGRSSPLSMSTTLRQPRPRVPSQLPISTYDGQEPGISALLERLYLDNSKELQHDFGPAVHEGPVRRRNATRHGFTARDSSGRKIEANLVANLFSHTDAINSIAVSPDHLFFVTASDDSTVKIWDTARLERNVTTKPRHTYGQHHARVKCVCTIESVHCFASAADDGSLHVVRVQVSQSGPLPKYNKLQVVREHRLDHVGEYITCMTHYNTETASNLIYATTHSAITILDLRTMRVLQTMENPRQYGPITAMCVDKKKAWIVVGSSTGVLTLWDKRFGILLKSWQAGQASGGRTGRIHQCAVHPTKGRGKWIMVAVEASRKGATRTSATIIEVWDIEKTEIVESFVVRVGSESDPVPEPQTAPETEVNVSPAEAIAALVRSRQGTTEAERRASLRNPFNEEMVPPPAPDVRAMVVGVDFGGFSTSHRSEFGDFVMEGTSSRSSSKGFVITGSEDRRLRLWDLGKSERTTILSGLDSDHDKPTYSSVSPGDNDNLSTPSSYVETWPPIPSGGHSSRPSQRISLISQHQQNLLKSHQDVITALALIDSPFRGGIVSGDRSGVLKVWRVDSGE
ncbi:other/VPS15 protein kinase [Ephemerocybe angulata]|uniref:non-specific serine/threonine protein kinase n=1 Tax=Ephemerocybe angulata TaxID=980116 RepID=A0A8H6LYW7_9AGAR|nr:other/VPS15 protein kinase [Tulosesus angulatus]